MAKLLQFSVELHKYFSKESFNYSDIVCKLPEILMRILIVLCRHKEILNLTP